MLVSRHGFVRKSEHRRSIDGSLFDERIDLDQSLLLTSGIISGLKVKIDD